MATRRELQREVDRLRRLLARHHKLKKEVARACKALVEAQTEMLITRAKIDGRHPKKPKHGS